MRGVARWTAPVAVAAALLLAPAAGAAIGVGATVCTIALRAPTGDVRSLAAVLRDEAIGGFEVRELIDRPTSRRTTSPKRRRRSSSSTACRRSSASSDTS